MDFLDEVGAAKDERTFVRSVVDAVQRLVPFDLPCVFAVVDCHGDLSIAKTTIGDQKWIRPFSERYWRIIPDLSAEEGTHTKRVDWSRYAATEYGTDFMRPQRIRFSLGIPGLGAGGGYVATLALDRSRMGSQFTDQEQAIMEIIQPHLSNLYRLFCIQGDLAKRDGPRTRFAVTQRESQIVDMLLNGLSNQEIGRRLGISERTVEAHCLHIYNKIGVKDRVELLVLARMRDVLPS